MTYTYPFNAIFKNGDVIEVKNSLELRALVKKHGIFGYEWLETCFSRRFRYSPFVETYPYGYEPKYFDAYYFQWIVRDFYGLKVDYHLVEFEPEPYKSWWYNGKRDAQRKAAVQGLPIPYIGSHRYRNRKYPKHGRRGVASRNAQDKQIFNKSKSNGDFDA